uniref:DegT/DnrJ/EryC1/StrS family aminotransferase n=1 Tax=Prevotella sp. TaxID=59823 RepID=UPI004026BBA4
MNKKVDNIKLQKIFDPRSTQVAAEEKIKYLDLKAINDQYQPEINEAIAQVLGSGWYLNGNALKQFEEAYAAFIGSEYCIGCGCGLDALKLILMGEIELGRLQKGNEILVPANTYYATILAITSVGLTPVLIDSRMDTLQIDERLIEQHITQKTKALMTVHLYGKLSVTPKILELCRKHQLLLFEDNAQAFACQMQVENSEASRKSIHTGNIGDAAAHSFYPGKNLGALGDAGAITTNDRKLAEVIISLRDYGRVSKYEFNYQGLNSRMEELQAAVLCVKLKNPYGEAKDRFQKVQYYLSKLDKKIVEHCIPKRLYEEESENVVHVFPFLTEKRDELRDYLSEHQVQTVFHYPIPPHQQSCYPKWNHLSFPVTERIAQQEISLPCNSTLKQGELDRIINLINRFFEERGI